MDETDGFTCNRMNREVKKFKEEQEQVGRTSDRKMSRIINL